VAPSLHGRVRWATVNLTAREEVARVLPAAIIFCRNVFIYFARDAIVRTVRGFAEGMNPPGCLFVGVSESLIRFTTDFELQDIAGAFVYIKR
jgi:chemotaxis protein methyltransferase CheR